MCAKSRRRKKNRIRSNSSERRNNNFLQLETFPIHIFDFHEASRAMSSKIAASPSLSHTSFKTFCHRRLAFSFARQTFALDGCLDGCLCMVVQRKLLFYIQSAHTNIFIYGEFPLIFSEFSLMAFCFLLPLSFTIKSSTILPASEPLSAARVCRHFSRYVSLRFVTITSLKALERRFVRLTVTRL